MASSSSSYILRNLSRRTPVLSRRLLPNSQRRWAQVEDIRFRDVRYLATQNVHERTLAKYKEALEKKAREEGHENLDKLSEAYKERIETLRKKAVVPGATGPLDAGTSQTTTANATTAPPSPHNLPKGPSPPPPPPSIPKPSPAIKSLSSYLDLEKVSQLPVEEIQTIWRLRHASSSQSLAFAMPVDTWSTIAQNARQHPQFILPLPREPTEEQKEDGLTAESAPVEIHFLQFAFPSPDAVTLLFTHLAEYKLRGEYSSPHTTITFHTELVSSHGLVLGQGSVLEGRGVSVEEGKWLLMCLQKFYGSQAAEKGRRGKELLEMFSSGNAAFKVQDLVDEAERI